jgi:hypothetical protein
MVASGVTASHLIRKSEQNRQYVLPTEQVRLLYPLCEALFGNGRISDIPRKSRQAG